MSEADIHKLMSEADIHKLINISIYCFFAEHPPLRSKNNNVSFGVMIICQSGATCQPVNCFSVHTLPKSNSMFQPTNQQQVFQHFGN